VTKEEVARIDVVIGHYSEQREKERSGKAWILWNMLQRTHLLSCGQLLLLLL
jgi:hypothetical protein